MKKKFIMTVTALFMAMTLFTSCVTVYYNGQQIDPNASNANVAIESNEEKITELDDTILNSDNFDEAVEDSDTNGNEADSGIQSSVEKVSESNSGSNNIEASVSVSNSWEDGEKICSQVNIIVKNHGKTDLETWNIDIEAAENPELVQAWGCEVEFEGKNIKVSGVDYNLAIAADSSIESGFIIKTDTAFTPLIKAVCGAVYTPYEESAATEKVKENIAPDVASRLVSEHGQLSLDGTQIVDEDGEPFQLTGMSTHGIQWFPQYVNEDVFRTLRDDWNCNVIRLAMYTGNSEGYTDSTKDALEQLLFDAVDTAIELDMYVIIDWHLLADKSPQIRKNDALRFFREASEKYAGVPNVIYEICNEPNGNVTWDNDIRPYADEVINAIRSVDKKNLIIVGTPTWSQDIDKVLKNPFNDDGVLYALHFYAATHKDSLRQRLIECNEEGLPVFVSEFGLCDSSGNGNNDFDEAEIWLDLLDELGISYCNWALADKNETCCALRPNASTSGNWSDRELSESGLWIKNWLLNKE